MDMIAVCKLWIFITRIPQINSLGLVVETLVGLIYCEKKLRNAFFCALTVIAKLKQEH